MNEYIEIYKKEREKAKQQEQKEKEDNAIVVLYDLLDEKYKEIERLEHLIAELSKELEQLQRKYDLAVAEREANVKGFTEELKKSKAEIEQLQEDIERLQDINNRDVENIKLAKLECARGIFAEIFEDCFDQFGYINYDALFKLKNKYVGGEQ